MVLSSSHAFIGPRVALPFAAAAVPLCFSAAGVLLLLAFFSEVGSPSFERFEGSDLSLDAALEAVAVDGFSFLGSSRDCFSRSFSFSFSFSLSRRFSRSLSRRVSVFSFSLSAFRGADAAAAAAGLVVEGRASLFDDVAALDCFALF